ncbi:ATP-dependent DNA helicase srs2 [Verticillium alfalfae VaMs.102]|uniref:DNA 3'-5' helicase n=1 Tax=Verticillium alfalfae (strain VaMs.102 / ATCC MYA-4576 / FGSC 10136) TaxID=526221 RepID=C9ST38_VERA1|nr:ATP-dependent DNA helicase srs2 [Verticillium alfalfae VaMs.102]EEY21953.1 ATP-dependent DNA helicase srs2 [Verticillium alfalfae VaMs.102]
MSLSSAAPSAAESLLASLNKAQCRAVTSSAPTVAILAGPGSGKTHTLTSRVVWLLENAGYHPADIVVATFTVKSAREMKERIGRALGDGREKKIVLGTFHSIARRYLATYGQRIGLSQRFGIADDGDSRAVIQRICKRLGLVVDPHAVRSWISKKKAKGSEQHIPQRPNAKKPRENPEFETCFRAYQDHLERSNLLDYDDLLTKCVELLRKHPSCVSNVQAVLIDEYQDTNGIQYELMRLFAQARDRITIVGDPDQSIYGWRSAEIKNLYRLLKDFPQTDEISLEENYRSSQAILDVSLKVIQQDKKRYQKLLLPVHNKGTRPVLRRLKTAANEAEWLVSEIRRAILMSGKMMNEDDVAILLRSAALSRHIESALGKCGIPYRMVGGKKFYERIEVKILIDYLRVIHQPENNDSLARIINVPRRGIGDVTIKSLVEEAETAKMDVWTLLTKHCRGDRKAQTNIKKAMEQKISGELIRMVMSVRKKVEEPPSGSPCYHLVDLIGDLLSQLNFQKYLQDMYPEEHEARWANVEEFINLAGDFMRELSATVEDDKLPTIDGVQQVEEKDALGRFLANVALASDSQKGETENKPMVTISTIHAAKGLEWPVVFVPAVYNGSIPHARAEDLDEERRLLYVAMTRAQSLLYLSCPLYSSQAGGMGGGGEKAELSTFLPTEIHQSFARRGPSFSTEVIQEVGRILGRADSVPSAERIFAQMPLLERLEDTLYPADPEESNPAGRADKSGFKRHRGPQANGDTPAEAYPQWQTATTMEAASGFTLPGFTTAGAHQTAIAAAKEVAQAAEAAGPQRKQAGPGHANTRRAGTTKRPPDQRSLLGFVNKRQKSDPSGTASEPTPVADVRSGLTRHVSTSHSAVAPYPRGQQAPPHPAAPALPGHRLTTPTIAKPTAKSRPPAGEAQAHYGFLSSSPAKSAVPQPGDDDAEAEPVVAPEARERPASCLHATTSMGQGVGRFERPALLKKEGGIAPIDRLRKPFKPLTMNRR